MRISCDAGDNTDCGYNGYVFCVFHVFLFYFIFLLKIQKCRDREVNRII